MRFLAILALAFASFAAHAGGFYSGIWQSQNTGAYVIVSQNGNDFIVTTYSNVPASNIAVPFINGQSFYISSLDVGDLVKGTLNGNYLELSGIAAFRACNFTYGFTFTGPNTISVQLLAAWPTAEGANQYIDCAQIRDYVIAATGYTQQYVRVF